MLGKPTDGVQHTPSQTVHQNSQKINQAYIVIYSAAGIFY